MHLVNGDHRQAANKVCVVLPFYRAGRFMSEAIASVLDQRGFDNWELCLVNDGSDETDTDIAHDFRRRYPEKIQLLEHPGSAHKGISASRNLAIRHTTGDYIAFLDADDVWCAGKLERQVADLDTHKTADMVYGSALRWNSWTGGTDVHVPVFVDNFGADCLVPGQAVLATFLRDESQTPCTGSVMVRRTAVEKAGYFEETFIGLYDDQVFYSKICRFAQIYVSSECLSLYRQHPASCCRQAEAQDTGVNARTAFLEWLRQYEETHGLAPAEPALPSR